jgi:peptide subunit release factor 1 (eRF1)
MRNGTLTELETLAGRLAAFEPAGLPVLSLYLDTRPDRHGRLSVDLFLKNELRARAESFAAPSPERGSFERDRERILTLVDQLQPAAGGLAVFACAGAGGFFEQARFDAPVERHELIVADRPHIYPLLRLMDQYPPYAVLVADTNAARLFVFGRGTTLRSERVEGVKTTRTSMGGWSQMRYQRHVDNYHLQHAKEVVAALDAAVRQDGVEQIVLAGDEVIIPLLREQLPPHLAERIVDILRLDITTPERAVLEATTEAVRRHDARTDAEQVREMLDQYRSGQLGVVGMEATLQALERGQVDTLLISASPEQVRGGEGESGADRLVRLAHATSASVSFIEDASLLAGVGGVGALLRFRMQDERSTGA